MREHPEHRRKDEPLARVPVDEAVANEDVGAVERTELPPDGPFRCERVFAIKDGGGRVATRSFAVRMSSLRYRDGRCLRGIAARHRILPQLAARQCIALRSSHALTTAPLGFDSVERWERIARDEHAD